jgi:alpha-L-rhamnosidase
VDDWSAVFIRPGEQRVTLGPRGVYLARTWFDLAERPEAARLRATALGVYELSVNASPVTDTLMRPGWTKYETHLQFQEVDVTSLLREGRNVLGAWVAPGWYGGRVRRDRDALERDVVPELLVELAVDRANGTVEVVAATSEAWEWTPSEILASDLYDGEVVDLRRARPGWSSPAASDLGRWEGVDLAPGTGARLAPEVGPSVRVLERRQVEGHRWFDDGTVVVDTGRNETGYVRLFVDVPAGARVSVVHGEVLDVDGRVYTENLRSARCVDEFTCAGGGVEDLAPRFSFRGFRYAEVRGLAGPAQLIGVERVVVGSGMAQVGVFSCSEPILEAIWHNVLTSQRANFVEVPTDCPQRDERLGWMADALLFSPLAAFNYDISSFMSKWLDDVLDARTASGFFTDIAPRPSGRTTFRNLEGAPAWADAGVLLPWVLYQRYGDSTVLERMFPAMLHWLRQVHAANPDGLWRHRRGRDYGDWVPAGPDTSHTLFSSCWLYRSTVVAAAIAELVGASEEQAWCASQAALVRQAFSAAFVDPGSGRIADPAPDSSSVAARRFAPTTEAETQTGYVLPIVFGLVDGDVAQRSAARLVELVESAGRRLTTGFIGSAFLLDALERAGAERLALELLMRDEFPSLGYMVRRGATSIWERWDGLMPGAGPACASMNSFNHYALSSMFSWAITGLCGLRPSEREPAFRRFGFAPVASRRLSEAHFGFDAPVGRIEVGWSWSGDDELAGELVVPVGATARVASEIAVDERRATAVSPGALRDVDDEPTWPANRKWWSVGPGRQVVHWRLTSKL